MAQSCGNVKKPTAIVFTIELGVKPYSNGDESVDGAFGLLCDGEDESKLAESLDTCTEVIKNLVQGVVEGAVRLREGVYGREVGNTFRPL
jgi:hypothetical protein